MKKILSLLLLLVFCITGCQQNTSDNGNDKPSENTTSENTKCFYVVNNTTIIPGKDFAPMYEKLGEPVSFSEAASCYYDGMDKVYTYEGFEIKTYPVNDKDYVQDICMSSEIFSTDKGISIGSTLEEVVAAYGEDYELIGKMYKYYFTEDTYMYFFIMNDAVKYFGYAIEAAN